MRERKAAPEVKNTYTRTLNSFSTLIIEIFEYWVIYVYQVFWSSLVHKITGPAINGSVPRSLTNFFKHLILFFQTFFPNRLNEKNARMLISIHDIYKFGRPGFKTIPRKVKDAWDSKRDVLIQSGAFAIKQLSEAMSVKAESYKLSEGITQTNPGNGLYPGHHQSLDQHLLSNHPGLTYMTKSRSMSASPKQVNILFLSG
ncbi:hypothetical protein POM88_016538 [Heracleum sosnowskyi]|uniref:Uncharacterized protein n=1 Tax=Heracleum sosnowskyi TaxID=360622 RepID=A0AAD8IQT1_9APIA|nr:hypothetical protein POM88_016538 [Heracleum sosnowskyi]